MWCDSVNRYWKSHCESTPLGEQWNKVNTFLVKTKWIPAAYKTFYYTQKTTKNKKQNKEK